MGMGGSSSPPPLSCRVPLPCCHPTYVLRDSAGSTGRGTGVPSQLVRPYAVCMHVSTHACMWCPSLTEQRWCSRARRPWRMRSPARAEVAGDSGAQRLPLFLWRTGGAGWSPHFGWLGVRGPGAPGKLLLNPILLLERRKRPQVPNMVRARGTGSHPGAADPTLALLTPQPDPCISRGGLSLVLFDSV